MSPVRRAETACVFDGCGRFDVGFVKRVARDGRWADVRWQDPERGVWVKRMPTSALRVLHTIPLGDGWEVTDLTREAELGGREP